MIVLSELEAVLIQFCAAQPGGNRAAFIAYATGRTQATVPELAAAADAVGQYAFNQGFVDVATFNTISNRVPVVGLIRATEIIRTMARQSKLFPVGPLAVQAVTSELEVLDALIAATNAEIVLVNNLTPAINGLPVGALRQTAQRVQTEALASRNTKIASLALARAQLVVRLTAAQAG